MTWVNYIYYCIYRFILKTPARSNADVWPIVFLALTICTHAISVYFVLTLFTHTRMDPTGRIKVIGIISMVILMLFFFVHYTARGNGVRVIRSFDKLGNNRNYARMGAFMFVETTLLPLTLMFALLLSQKLTWWPR
jgi:hypothetical protein